MRAGQADHGSWFLDAGRVLVLPAGCILPDMMHGRICIHVMPSS